MKCEKNVLSEQKQIYDIGLVCVINRNIGNNLTNYALYQYLRDLNYRILLISNPWNMVNNIENVRDSRFDLFMQKPYSDSDVSDLTTDKHQLSNAGLLCNLFLLGSDQLWRKVFLEKTDYFTCLDWVDSRKYKIAYGTSFGVEIFEGDIGMKKKAGFLLSRFHKISVRESDGIKLVEELCGNKADSVVDPVFLCERKHYEEMAEKGKERLPSQRYVGAYLLDITDEKESVVLDVSGELTSGIYAVMTEPDSDVDKQRKLHVLRNSFIEEWLALIKNCDFFITDSFHGLCFALIFQKPFCVIFDRENWRGLNRIQSMLDRLELGSRFMEKYDSEKIRNLCKEKIDYRHVNKILFKECEKSKDWLSNALKQGNVYKGNHDLYDFLWETYNDLYQEIQNVREMCRLVNYRTRNELFMLSRIFMTPEIGRLRKPVQGMQIVGWGAGDCFDRNINYIKKFCDIKYVCDSNPEKWGREMGGHVICISPETLSKMENMMVIIMVDQAAMAFQIAGELLRMGIRNFEHVENWLSYVRQESV